MNDYGNPQHAFLSPKGPNYLCLMCGEPDEHPNHGKSYGKSETVSPANTELCPVACCYCGEGSQDHDTCRKAVEWERTKQSRAIASAAKEAARQVVDYGAWPTAYYPSMDKVRSDIAAIIVAAYEKARSK